MPKIPETGALALDLQTLRRMAGARSFGRGQDYVADGRVGAIVERGTTLHADVRGSRTYRVKLWSGGKQLEYSCTCPVGADGEFCKHAVAVALAHLADPGPAIAPDRGRAISKADLRADLAARSHDELVALLLDQAEDDAPLRRRLTLQAARGRKRKPNLAAYRDSIDDAVATDDFISYQEMFSYAQGIEKVVDALDDLLKAGDAAAVIDLAEYALAAIEKALESTDDSDGLLGEILERLQRLHHSACIKGKPDPAALAARLFAWELRTSWDTFSGAAQTYASVLGKSGLRIYRELAQAQWSHVAVLAPGTRNADDRGRRFRITRIMEALARQSGNLDELIAVMARDLSSAYAFLEIAEACRKARRRDLALNWAERGLEAFPQRTDSRLRAFVADEYHRRRRHDEALALMWAAFTDAPELDSYRTLRAHARRARQWPVWRDKALAHLRANGKAPPRNATRWSVLRPDHSTLVEIFLDENAIDSAWDEARAGGCAEHLWLQLATLRENDHPEDAIAIYRRQIEPAVLRTNNGAYRDAVGWLRKVRTLMQRAGKDSEFAAYLGSVRAAHQRKRNFMRLLDHAKWG